MVFAGTELVYTDALSHQVYLIYERLVYEITRTTSSCCFIKEIKSFSEKGYNQFLAAISSYRYHFFFAAQRVMFKCVFCLVQTVDATSVCSYIYKAVFFMQA